MKKLTNKIKSRNLSPNRERLAIEIEIGRKEKELSQRELAKKSGIHLNTYKKIIGTAPELIEPKLETLLKIAQNIERDGYYLYNILHPEIIGCANPPGLWTTRYIEFEIDIGETDNTGNQQSIITKKILNTVNKNFIEYYIHHIGSDGNFDKESVSVSPGKVEMIRKREFWYVKQKFPLKYNTGDTVEIALRYSVKNAFINPDEEFWTYRCNILTNGKVKIDIILPKSKLCKKYKVVKTSPALGDVEYKSNLQKNILSNGRELISWTENNPEYPQEYTIYWEW